MYCLGNEGEDEMRGKKMNGMKGRLGSNGNCIISFQTTLAVTFGTSPKSISAEYAPRLSYAEGDTPLRSPQRFQ